MSLECGRALPFDSPLVTCALGAHGALAGTVWFRGITAPSAGSLGNASVTVGQLTSVPLELRRGDEVFL
jgi:hypothetical protein